MQHMSIQSWTIACSDFAKLRQEASSHDETREKIIKRSRGIMLCYVDEKWHRDAEAFQSGPLGSLHVYQISRRTPSRQSSACIAETLTRLLHASQKLVRRLDVHEEHARLS